MHKEKLFIPMPKDSIIEQEIQQIIASGAQQKESFFQFMKSMMQQVGIRQLFSDRTEFHFIVILFITSLSMFFIQSDGALSSTKNHYSSLFLMSPLLFLVFSIYTYITKIQSATYEVEMACKYNVYQILGFRMLAFSVLTILTNTGMILVCIALYDNMEFMRAFMISTTGLFVFSITFIYFLMKRRSTFTAVSIIIGWLVLNLMLKGLNSALYSEFLFNMPLFVYAFVLGISMIVYIQNLKKLIQIKQMEGAF